MVSADNAGQVPIIGIAISGGYRDGEAIRADITLFHLPSQNRELSCGYTLDLDETPGITPQGERYDAVQKNVRINHIALVPKGRAGIARLNMDGSQELEERKEEENMGDKMMKVRLDNGLEYEADPEVGIYVERLRRDVAEGKKTCDTLQAKYDTALSELEKAKKEREDAQAEPTKRFDEAVKSRVALLSVAKEYKVDRAEDLTGGLTEDDLRRIMGIGKGATGKRSAPNCK